MEKKIIKTAKMCKRWYKPKKVGDYKYPFTNNAIEEAILDNPNKTYQQIGDIVGVSRQRVHQIAKRMGIIKRKPKPVVR